jgi:hypothetical protein
MSDEFEFEAEKELPTIFKLTDERLTRMREYRESKRIRTKKAESLKVTLDDIKEALTQAKGAVFHAATLLGTTGPVLRRKIQMTPSLQLHLDNIKQDNLDKAEYQLISQAERGILPAVVTYLKTQGKERGYTERATVEHEVGNTAKNAAALIEAMRKAAQEEERPALPEPTTVEIPEKDYTWVEEPKSHDLTS